MANPDYQAACEACVQPTQAAEAALPLRTDRSGSIFKLQADRSSKIFLFFHGFTAVPCQFELIAQMFYNAGYSVIVPLLPGHGQAGDWGKASPPPLPTAVQPYQDHALAWLDQVQDLGDQVIVGGLSGGGAIAAWLALERPQAISRAVLFAPYFSNCSLIVDLFVNHMQGYFEWVPKNDHGPGYGGFEVPALRVFPRLGKELMDRSASAPSPPMFIISTETDIAVSNGDHETFCDNIRARQPLTWYYCFDKALNIPHSMMNPQEGNEWTNVMNIMVKAYIESDLAWTDLEEIAYRMTAGQTFDQVVADLGLQDKVSADMPAMLTMVDARAIVLKREPGWTTDS
jgi:pimeloyl-ACP methyl ester carboxylesterase